MKFCAAVILLLAPCLLFAQGSLNITLLDNWHDDTLLHSSSGVRYGDCYGFTWNGGEYAVAASTEGTHVFLLSPEGKFIPKGFVRGRYSNVQVQHRDYAVYDRYLYAVGDEGIADLQIIDLNYLPDSLHLAHEDSVQFGRVHNIFVDTLNKLFFSCIHRTSATSNTSAIAAAMKVFSLEDPLHLQELWSGPDDIQEVHDIYVRDGKAIMNCGYDGLRVYNFKNNPSNPEYLQNMPFYQDQGYCHEGWLSPAGNVYVFADETNGKRVKYCTFDGENVTIEKLFGVNYQNGSIPHNIMITDTLAFVAYYNEGFQVFDMRYPVPKRIAYYDTYPKETEFKMNGDWGLYTLLPSQRIIASDREFGLFLFEFDRSVFEVFVSENESAVYPNPVPQGEMAEVRLPLDISVFNWSLTDMNGKIVRQGTSENDSYFELKNEFEAGIYMLNITFDETDTGLSHIRKKILFL